MAGGFGAFLVAFFSVGAFAQDYGSVDYSHCDSSKTESYAAILTASGGVRTGSINFNVEVDQYGGNHYWKEVVAYKYVMPKAEMVTATCWGNLTQQLRKGSISVKGKWYRASCAYTCSRPEDHFRTLVGPGEITVEITDYVLDAYGRERVLVKSRAVNNGKPFSMLIFPGTHQAKSEFVKESMEYLIVDGSLKSLKLQRGDLGFVED